MPELPEVETMVRGLRQVLEGRRILKVEVADRHVLQGVSLRRFQTVLGGNRAKRIWRRGKWVIWELTDGHRVLVKPRMTGGFRADGDQRPAHARIHFHLAGPCRDLWYCDLRRLGTVALLDEVSLHQQLQAAFHGPEATEVTPRCLLAAMGHSRRPIKAALLDQRLLAGLGNIYADESLFDARIDPQRPCCDLTAADLGRLCRSIRRILAQAIRLRGSTTRDYFTVFGQPGAFQNRHRVYGRAGLPCPRCSQPIVRAHIRGLASRSTHYCPRCQPPA